MKSLNVNLENLTTKERATLTTLIEKSQKPVVHNLLEPPFKDGDYYLYKHPFLDDAHVKEWNNSPGDRHAYDLDNTYPYSIKGRKNLEKHVIQQKAIVEVNRRVKMLIQEQHPNWNCDWTNYLQNKTYPYYAWANREVRISCSTTTQDQFMLEYAPKGIYEQIDTNLLKKAMGVE